MHALCHAVCIVHMTDGDRPRVLHGTAVLVLSVQKAGYTEWQSEGHRERESEREREGEKDIGMYIYIYIYIYIYR